MDGCDTVSRSVLPVTVRVSGADISVLLCTMHQPRLVGALTNPDFEVGLEAATCAEHGPACLVANVVIARAGEEPPVNDECVGTCVCVMATPPERVGEVMGVLTPPPRVSWSSVCGTNPCARGVRPRGWQLRTARHVLLSTTLKLKPERSFAMFATI